MESVPTFFVGTAVTAAGAIVGIDSLLLDSKTFDINLRARPNSQFEDPEERGGITLAISLKGEVLVEGNIEDSLDED